jgi:hypothetical protein
MTKLRSPRSRCSISIKTPCPRSRAYRSTFGSQHPACTQRTDPRSGPPPRDHSHSPTGPPFDTADQRPALLKRRSRAIFRGCSTSPENQVTPSVFSLLLPISFPGHANHITDRPTPRHLVMTTPVSCKMLCFLSATTPLRVIFPQAREKPLTILGPTAEPSGAARRTGSSQDWHA